MSKLEDAGLPDAPEGMYWYVNSSYDGDIRLALMAPASPRDAGWVPGTESRVVKSIWLVDAGELRPDVITAGLLRDRANSILSWYQTMEENKKWLGEAG